MPRDRRIGARVRIVPVVATWTRAGTTRRRRFRRVRAEPVRLVEVSVSGGLVIASTCDTFQIGTLMVLDIGGSQSVVEVRNIRPIEDGASFAVGVLFVSLAPDVQRRVHGAVAAFHERNRAPTKSL